MDSFQFQFFDGKEFSFPATVTLTVTCKNNPPYRAFVNCIQSILIAWYLRLNFRNFPQDVKAEDGTDIIINLGGIFHMSAIYSIYCLQ